MSDLRKYVGNRSPFDDLRHIEDDGTEWWSAREMMPYLGYERFENLENVLRKAKSACRNTNHSVDSIFRDVTKNAGRGRNYKDVQMTRFGAYLVAMNGDPDKPEIAAAQRYFAVQTYRAETQIPAVETVHIQQLRPWGERLSDTFKDHRLAVQTTYGYGAFTTYTATVGEILMIEDELIHHQIPLKYGDLPDGSIGKMWSLYRKKEGLDKAIGTAPLFMPHIQQGITVDVLVYDEVQLSVFKEWLNTIYIPENMPNYFAGKKEWKPLYLATASAADRASLRLTGKPALISGPLRHELDRAGGFISATTQPPKLS